MPLRDSVLARAGEWDGTLVYKSTAHGSDVAMYRCRAKHEWCITAAYSTATEEDMKEGRGDAYRKSDGGRVPGRRGAADLDLPHRRRRASRGAVADRPRAGVRGGAGRGWRLRGWGSGSAGGAVHRGGGGAAVGGRLQRAGAGLGVTSRP